MIKVNRVLISCVLGSQLILASPVYSAVDQATLLAKCEPLLSKARGILDAHNMKTSLEASAITGGGSLSDAACIDNLLDFDFDAFSSVGGLEDLFGGLMGTLKDEAMDSLKSMACDFADDLKAEADDFISCTANLSIDLGVAAGLSPPSLESCLGTGISEQGYNFNFSGGEGDHSLSRRLEGGFGSGSGNELQNESANELLNSLKDKAEDLKSLDGR